MPELLADPDPDRASRAIQAMMQIGRPMRRAVRYKQGVMSGDLSNGMTAATVNGAEMTIGTMNGVTVNGASLVTADIEAANGVIHIIHPVILPPED